MDKCMSMSHPLQLTSSIVARILRARKAYSCFFTRASGRWTLKVQLCSVYQVLTKRRSSSTNVLVPLDDFLATLCLQPHSSGGLCYICLNAFLISAVLDLS